MKQKEYKQLSNAGKLFGAVKLTKHVDVDLYKCSGYGIGFYRKGFFSISDEVERNVIIFGADMSSSSHIENKKKDILILIQQSNSVIQTTLKEKI